MLNGTPHRRDVAMPAYPRWSEVSDGQAGIDRE
jgi:hypothetical protein